MKRSVLVLFLFFSVMIFAQNNTFQFDKNFYECEDNWVIIPPREDEKIYTYGFIYLDNSAGYTFRFGGDFTIDADGKYIATNADENSLIIYRLESNTVKMSLIPDDKLKELGIKKTPDWLSNYKVSETPENLIRKGYHLNHIGASSEAIPILLSAYKINPHLSGLEFELSFAYNATEQYQKAVDVLEKALKKSPKDHMFYRELGYSYINLKEPLKAEKIYKKGISISKDDSQKAEMAYNMAGVYYRSKNKSKFDEWAAQVKTFAKSESQFAKKHLTDGI